MGQTRTSADVCDTTASPPEADMTELPRDVAEMPIPDIPCRDRFPKQFQE